MQSAVTAGLIKRDYSSKPSRTTSKKSMQLPIQMDYCQSSPSKEKRKEKKELKTEEYQEI